MRVPDVYSADYIADYPTQFEHKGKWFLARPLGRNTFSIKERLHIAWRVFKGDMDAVAWFEPPRKYDVATDSGRLETTPDREINDKNTK